VDTGASDFYLTPSAPVTNLNPSATTVTVSDASGKQHCSTAQAEVLLNLPNRNAKIMPSFQHNLMGIGKLCDNDCRVVFDKTTVTVLANDGSTLLQGWREQQGAKLWRFSLIPNQQVSPKWATQTPMALNARDLPSVGALVHYLHAAAGFPVKATWLAAIKAGNYASWPGLTYANAAKHCPSCDETIKGHLTQVRQGIRSTKPKPPQTPTPARPSLIPHTASKELHVWDEPISKLFTDDMGRFPVRSRSGNQYLMLAYHCDTNAILVEPFQSRHDRHRIPAYNKLMSRLTARAHTIDHQVLDNEASAEYRRVITKDWNCSYQLVPPNVHRRNIAERAIQTFKAHFLSILAGLPSAFPNYLWDMLIPQTELTLNLLRQSHIAPALSAWEAYNNAPYNFDATPIGPCGCPVIIHNNPNKRLAWAFRGREGFSIGPALEHYRCFQVVDSLTKALVISDTVEFRHDYLAAPAVSYEDRLLHAINFLSTAINEATDDTCNAQLIAIDNLREIFNKWQLTTHPLSLLPQTPSPATPVAPAQPPPSRNTTHSPRVMPTPGIAPPKPLPAPTPASAPRVSPTKTATPSPRVPASTAPPVLPVATRTRSQRIPASPGLGEAIALRTRSRTLAQLSANRARVNLVMLAHAAQASNSNSSINAFLAASVLDHETGKSLEYRQLIKHPKYNKLWSSSYAKELGRLCQGFTGTTPTGTPVDGTDTFHVINFSDIPPDRLKQVCYSNVVCKVRPEKDDPARTRITIAGNRICYPGDVGTKTAPLELVKLLINSVLSRQGAKFCTFDISNFYLQTPLDRPEYIKIKITDIPQEFINEYNLFHHVHNDWVYFEIRKGIYGLPQSGILAQTLLADRLAKKGYYQCECTPGLWRHKWRPVMFTLIVDDFGVEYVGKQHAYHLRDTIKEFYELTENWNGDLYAGINLAWNYSKRTCRLSMADYIETVLTKYNHQRPRRPILSPYKAAPIIYGATAQYTDDDDTSPALDAFGIKRIQGIVGALLYYARAVDNKLLHALSEIGTQQAAATEATNTRLNHLLDYCATYPNDGILYHASNMILAAHSDAAYLNASKSRSRAGAHIMLSEDNPIPSYNGPILTLAQIIKFVASSAAEAELAALYICAKEMVPLRNSLEEMGWPQPKSPIQTDNTTALGVANKTIITKRMKSMDMRLWWLRCRASQGQFRYYWAPGAHNHADYPTKAHPDIYHESMRPTHAS
jgi:hypothetical protein